MKCPTCGENTPNAWLPVLYGHLFPGAQNEAAGLLDNYLDAAGGHGA